MRKPRNPNVSRSNLQNTKMRSEILFRWLHVGQSIHPSGEKPDLDLEALSAARAIETESLAVRVMMNLYDRYDVESSICSLISKQQLQFQGMYPLPQRNNGMRIRPLLLPMGGIVRFMRTAYASRVSMHSLLCLLSKEPGRNSASLAHQF